MMSYVHTCTPTHHACPFAYLLTCPLAHNRPHSPTLAHNRLHSPTLARSWIVTPTRSPGLKADVQIIFAEELMRQKIDRCHLDGSVQLSPSALCVRSDKVAENSALRHRLRLEGARAAVVLNRQTSTNAGFSSIRHYETLFAVHAA